jgi:3-hydroxyisobutyrate dehydrogenase-like beta-hydroxyacid dehydrogenase
MTQHVGIIGLGIMGTAYAKNLLAKGFQVSGSDPLPEARSRLAQLGGTAHDDAGDWLADCDLIILALLSPVAMHAVTDVLAITLRPGQIVLETGTFALDDKIRAQHRLKSSDIILLDCPVSGTGAQAMSADILMMMSGPQDAIETARPFVEAITKGIIVAGDFGAGTQLKFVANHAVALHNTAAAETLAYADALGLDRAMIYQMLSTGAGQSRMSDLRMPLMIKGAYEPPTATLKMFEKDLRVIGDDIARLGLKAPLFVACANLYAEASRQLPETYDTASVFEVYKRQTAK